MSVFNGIFALPRSVHGTLRWVRGAGHGVAVLPLMIVMSACRVVSPPPPQPLAPPELPLPHFEEELLPELLPMDPLPRPVPSTTPDAIMLSPLNDDPDFRAQVARWIEFWSVQNVESFRTFLERMGRYRQVVDRALTERELPGSLRYLPIVESGYVPTAVSRASAVGMWQFMATTARSMGLQVSGLVDERRDPVRSTLAAARFLSEQRERFGSWALALAAYNGGPARVERLLARHAPGAEPHDSLLAVLAPYLPRETRDFFPRFMAAATLAEHADRYGVVPLVTAAPLVYEEVVVPDATSLDVVALAAEVAEEEVLELNPHIMRRVTPGGRPTTVRVPRGTSNGFLERYAAIPVKQRVTVTEHVVASGETLTHVAGRYRVSISELRAANPGVRPRRMQIGQRLLVPLVPGPSDRSRTAGARRADPGYATHVVEHGDTLWGIARRYAVRISDLLLWNRLGARTVLQPGQKIQVSSSGGSP